MWPPTPPRGEARSAEVVKTRGTSSSLGSFHLRSCRHLVCCEEDLGLGADVPADTLPPAVAISANEWGGARALGLACTRNHALRVKMDRIQMSGQLDLTRSCSRTSPTPCG